MDLDALYEAVPAALEEDLLDEVIEERRNAEHDAWLRCLDGEPTPAAEPDQPEVDEPPLRPGQVLGLLQHQLGAVVLPDED